MISFEEQILKEQEEQNKNKDVQGTLSKAKQDLKEKTKVSKEHLGDILYFSMFSLLIVGMLGIFELLDASYDKNMFASALFWADYGILQGSIWAVRVMVKKLGDRKEMRNNLVYITYQENIQDKVNIDKETPFIDKNAQLDDINRKVKAFRNKQKLRIINLGLKHKINNLFQYLKDIESIAIDDLKPFELLSDKKLSDRKTNALNSKINELSRTLTNEWIAQNIDTQRVKYNKVSRAILTNGIVATSNNKEGEDFKEHSTKEFFKNTLPSFILSLLFMLLILPLDGKFKSDAGAWFKLITKLGLVFFSGFMMWVDNPELFKRTKIKAISERSNKLNQYYNKKNN